MKPRAHTLSVLVLSLALGALAWAAGMYILTSFMLYDDEGYVLISLRNFSEHGGLYRDVYSQYGPLPYVLYALLAKAGMPLTHTAGRLVTLGLWTACAGACAGLVWRATRSLAPTLAAMAGTFSYLWIMVNEPNHPGGLVAAVTAAAALLGYRALDSGSTRVWALVAGTAVALLALTKINVGVFAAVSAAAVWGLYCQRERLRSLSPWILAVGFSLMAPALMRTLLSEPWVQTYAVLFSLSALAAIVAATQGEQRKAAPGEPCHTFKDVALGGGALLLVALLVCGFVASRGSTVTDLVAGIVLRPLQHPGHFSLAYPWLRGSVTLAILSFGTAISLGIVSKRGEAQRALTDRVVAALRIAAGLGTFASVAVFPAISPDRGVMSFGIPWVWTYLWPLPPGSARTNQARAWVGFLLIGQWLHAYPVPGSQIAWGTFLLIPLAALAAWEAALFLVPNSHRARVGATALALGIAGWIAVRFVQVSSRYEGGRDLGLPGAEALRLPDSATGLYRLLSLNAAAHADVLFSMPGMFSFNLWTGQPTPTLANVTHWFSLLTVPEQQAVIASLEAHPRSCVIVQADHVAFLRSRSLAPAGPLFDYVESHYATAFSLDGFEFRVRKGRTVVALQTGEYLERAGPPSVADPGALLTMNILVPAGATIASIDLAPMDGTAGPLLTVGPSAARIECTSIRLDGTARSGPTQGTLPVTPTGPTRLSVYMKPIRPAPGANEWVVLRDPKGNEIAIVRLRP